MGIVSTPSRVRLAALRGWMKTSSLDGYLVTSADAHQSEDCPDHDRTLRWLTGFSGSLGRALVLADRAILFVDGRYQVQASQQVDLELWEIVHLLHTPPEDWIAAHGAGLKIGFDPMLWTVNQAQALRRRLNAANAQLVPRADDPFDAIWTDRPAPPCAPVREMSEALAGESGAHKRGRLREHLAAESIAVWVESRPDEIAWLLNMRGSDIPMHPVPLSFALIPAEGPMEWFVAPEKIQDATIDPDVTVFPYSALADRTRALGAELHNAGLDPGFAPDALALMLTEAGVSLVEQSDPIMSMKAVKNPAELDGYRNAHIADGAAWVNFLAWLDREVPLRAAAGNPVTECEAAETATRFRAEQDGFLEASFTPIAAAGSNAAMCHYAPTPGYDAPILPDGLFLLDSGGQYRGGTTDATRTVAFGPVSTAQRKTATAVLRGFLDLSMARFPTGTFPHQLDALARAPLWALDLDYDHGTGHGVGHNLLVHEHPHRFGPRANSFPLVPGNIMTIEPGYYAEGQYGLRIENQVELVEVSPGFCAMTPLTLVPIDLSFMDIGALSDVQRGWLDAYHDRVRSVLLDRVAPDARAWLIERTQPIGA